MANRTRKTSQKAASKKAPGARRPRRKKPSFSGQLLRVAGGMVLLVSLVVAAGFLVHQLVKRPAPVSPPPPRPTRQAPAKPPPFEIYPEKDEPVRPPTGRKKPLPAPGLPKVSLIVDDLGYDRRMAERFLALDALMTVSILPHGPVSKRIARMAEEKGWEVMLHLPMEPNEYPQIQPGPGALLTAMAPDELIHQLNRNIDAVPSVRGVNNHMGSKLTTRSTQLYQVFSILKKRDLYFIDSRTTPETVCRASARLFQLRFAERDVFIDHLQDPAFIRKQLRRLVKTAESHGEAVGIAHPHRLTAQILQEMLPELKQKVLLVPASLVVHPAG